MRIEVSLGESLKSSHDDKILLPQIRVSSSAPFVVHGLYDDKPHALELKIEESLYVATFFLHENITAHCKIGDFNLFITNTRYFIYCLVCNEKGTFRSVQENIYSGERERGYSDTMLQDRFFLEEDKKLIIEPLSMDKETDKHVSI